MNSDNLSILGKYMRHHTARIQIVLQSPLYILLDFWERVHLFGLMFIQNKIFLRKLDVCEAKSSGVTRSRSQGQQSESGCP